MVLEVDEEEEEAQEESSSDDSSSRLVVPSADIETLPQSPQFDDEEEEGPSLDDWVGVETRRCIINAIIKETVGCL